MSLINGLIAATFTPMRSDGSLNLSQIEPYAAHLLSAGLAGLFVCGTTGEGASMSTSERMSVAERWCQAIGKRLPVIVHVGHTSIEDSMALARHAQKSGAAGIAMLAPHFFKPDLAALLDYCQKVAAAAPELDFYYYHIPSMTGVNLPVADFVEQAADRIPNFAGVKFTYEDLLDLQNCLRVSAGRFNILFGRDEILLAGLALGCTGAVGSTYNFAAPIYLKIIAAFEKQDMAAARAAQQQAARMINEVVRYKGIPALKSMMKFAGVDCGPVRLPLHSLSAEQEKQMQTNLDACGWQQLLRR